MQKRYSRVPFLTVQKPRWTIWSWILKNHKSSTKCQERLESNLGLLSSEVQTVTTVQWRPLLYPQQKNAFHFSSAQFSVESKEHPPFLHLRRYSLKVTLEKIGAATFETKRHLSCEKIPTWWSTIVLCPQRTGFNSLFYWWAVFKRSYSLQVTTKPNRLAS